MIRVPKWELDLNLTSIRNSRVVDMADMFFLHSRKFTTRVFYTSCKQGWYGSIRVATWVEYALPEKLQEKFREMWLNGRVMQVSLRETETKAVADQYFGFNDN